MLGENGGSGKSRPEVDIVIVNWNSGSLLRECLGALDRSTTAQQLNVVIVDNNSADGSADRLAAEHIRIDLVRNTQNRGFAAACNQGAKRGNAPLLLFLNPDVRVRRDTVDRAAQYLTDRSNSDIGVVGVQLLDTEGRIQRSCARRPTVAMLVLRTMFLDRLFPALVPPHFLKEWDHRDTRPVDQVMGAFLMIRRTLFQKLGGFDERFFVYYEDVDLCLAARESGWNVVHFAGAQAEHVGGGTTEAIKDRRLCYEARSRVEYTAKRHGSLAAIVLSIFILVFELPIRWYYATVTISPREGWLVFCGTVAFYQSLTRFWLHLRTRESM
jgi:N-acetylglucosaminyl-diphospho-decaprenol L-rhamnosyltransferase